MLLAALLLFVVPGNSFLSGLSLLQTWWLMMVAISFSICLATVGTTWGWAGIVSASLLVGTSSQLAFTAPIWSQEIRVHLDTKFHSALFLAIMGQFSLAAYIWFKRNAWRSAAKIVKMLGVGRTAIFVVLMFTCSATMLSDISYQDFDRLLARFAASTAFLLINIGTVVAIAAALPDQRVAAAADFFRAQAGTAAGAAKPGALENRLPYLLAAWVLVVSALISVLVFERMAHLGDELAYVMQARYFALGRLSAEIPSVSLAPAFDYLNFTTTGDKWFSSFPPGWPLILTAGALLEIEWLVNPVLGAASILLAHGLFRRELDRSTANVVVLLMAVSPWLLAISASLMSHASTLALWLASCLLLSKSRDANLKNTGVLAFFSGLLMGLLFLARPLDGLVMAPLTGLWCLLSFEGRTCWRIVLAYGCGCLVMGALVFPYNAYLTGDPFLTPIDVFFEKRWGSIRSQLGFGSEVGPPIVWRGGDVKVGHSPTEAAVFLQHSGYFLNFELFGWGVGSLGLCLFHFLWGRLSRTDLFMVTVIIAILFAFSFYWFSNSLHIGPRYWYLTIVPFVFLTAAGIRTLSERMVAAFPHADAPGRVSAVVMVLIAVTMISFVSWRSTTKYFELRNFHADYRILLETRDLENGLVFIKDATPAEIGSASFFNPKRLDSRQPIFLRDLGRESNRAVAAAFPGRPIYFAAGRSADGTRARIVEGPVDAKALR